MDTTASLGCKETIPDTAAGYCDCGDTMRGFSSCEKKTFTTCEEVCKQPKGIFCKWRGSGADAATLDCLADVPKNAAGSCECEDGSKVGPFDGTKPFKNCFEACTTKAHQFSMWRA